MSVPKTAREMLDVIDAFLARFDKESEDLWMVLSALRGPDSEVWPYKKLGTVPIRRAAFPVCALRQDVLQTAQGNSSSASVNKIPADFGNPEDLKCNLPSKEYVSGVEQEWHFRFHCEDAAKVLNILQEVASES